MKRKTLLFTITTALIVCLSAFAPSDCLAKKGKKGRGGKGFKGHGMYLGQALNPETVAEYDRNGNGKLDEREIETMRKDRWGKVLEKYDSDGNGKLSADEKQAFYDKKDGKRPRWLAVLMKYDKNGDGKLSTGEKRDIKEQKREFRQAD